MTCEIDSEGVFPECFIEKNRKARKTHICCECGETIEKGDLYRYESGIWEGEPKDYKTCVDCLSVRDTFCCSFVYGGLWEDMQDMIDNYESVSSNKINLLTPKAKQKVIALIDSVTNRFETNYFEEEGSDE